MMDDGAVSRTHFDRLYPLRLLGQVGRNVEVFLYSMVPRAGIARSSSICSTRWGLPMAQPSTKVGAAEIVVAFWRSGS